MPRTESTLWVDALDWVNPADWACSLGWVYAQNYRLTALWVDALGLCCCWTPWTGSKLCMDAQDLVGLRPVLVLALRSICNEEGRLPVDILSKLFFLTTINWHAILNYRSTCVCPEIVLQR